MVRVAVVGAGYWGPNLIRNFAACPDTHLVAVCDRDEQRLTKAIAGYAGVEAISNFDDLLQSPGSGRARRCFFTSTTTFGKPSSARHRYSSKVSYAKTAACSTCLTPTIRS